jgi:hypothetical protein
MYEWSISFGEPTDEATTLTCTLSIPKYLLFLKQK